MQSDATVLDRPLYHQALYSRSLVLELLQSHHQPEQPAQAEVQTLLEGINSFLVSQGVSPLDADLYAAVSPEFGRMLLQRMNILTHQVNPLIASDALSELLKDGHTHRWLAGLYEHISDYLLATRTPIERKNHIIHPDSASTASRVMLWKRVREKAADGTTHTRMVEVDQVDFTRKAVICFGGTAGIHGHEGALGGLMAIAADKLGDTAIHEEGLDFYGVSYPTFHRPYFFADTHRYNSDPESYYNATAKDCVHRLIFPLLETIAHPDAAKLKQLFSQLNFFAYSYGTVFVQQIRNCLEDLLKGLGYTAEAIEQAFSEVYAMHIGPTCRLDIPKETGNFSSVYVISPEDLSVASKSCTLSLMRHMEARGQKVQAISPNELLILSSTTRDSTLVSDTAASKKKIPLVTKSGSIPTPR